MSKLNLFKQENEPQHLKESTSKSFKALWRNGWLIPSYPGVYTYWTPMLRCAQKLSDVVSKSMDDIGGLRIALPHLCKENSLEQSGRLSSFEELFRLKDRKGVGMCIVPTCEESVSQMMATLGKTLSAQRLPIAVYQINTKFRDELHPRNGLLRSREFIMKDMYSFDTDEKSARSTYERVFQAYNDLLTKKLGLRCVSVTGSVGLMGGLLSHEFHVESEAGEDMLTICQSCNRGENKEIKYAKAAKRCEHCGGGLADHKGIEVAHTFLLGTRYSEPFNVVFQDGSGGVTTARLCWMGCYGIGITRLVQACIEHLLPKNSADSRISLPTRICPYLVCVIGHKEGSRQWSEKSITKLEILASLANEGLSAASASLTSLDVVVDDRHHLSVGRRIRDCANLGIPMVIVDGDNSVEVYWWPVEQRLDDQSISANGAMKPMAAVLPNELPSLIAQLFSPLLKSP